MPLSQVEQDLLKKVLEFAGDNENQVDEGLKTILKGVRDHGRWVYLFGRIKTEAKRAIRRARAKAEEARQHKAAVV